MTGRAIEIGPAPVPIEARAAIDKAHDLWLICPERRNEWAHRTVRTALLLLDAAVTVWAGIEARKIMNQPQPGRTKR